VASFFLQEPSTLLPPLVLLPPSSDPPEAPTTPTPIVSLPHITAAALDWASDSSNTLVISTQSPVPKHPHSPDQASDTSSSDDMDTDMEQNTLPFGNLAPVPDREDHDDKIAHTQIFEDSQEASSKLSTQQKCRHTTPSSLSPPEVPLPPLPSLDQQVGTMTSEAQQPEEAQEIQAVTLAFTQASCDDTHDTTETVPDVSDVS